MATVSKSFTATGSGDQYFVRVGDKLSYAVTGTFVGTWIFERSQDASNWEQIATGTSTASVSHEVLSQNTNSFNYRFRCSAYTSGTMVTAITDAASVVKPEHQFKDANGSVVMELIDGGVNFPGTAAHVGAVSFAAAASVSAGGLAVSSGQMTRYFAWSPSSLTAGTSTTPSATTVYLAQVFIRANCTLTGVTVSNGATVGTNKYVVALFDSSGAVVANSALAGVLTTGADVYQAVAFTATYAAVGPAVYWIGLYVDGTTDRFRSVPAVGANAGLCGSVTGQTFGTVASVTLPTTFTADKGPVGFVY